MLKVEKAPTCSHCKTTMERYDLPPVAFSDGLGWGTTFLWVCPSDECPIFRKGYHQTIENYGHTASMRVIVEPDSGIESVTPAFSLDPEHFKSFVETRKKSREDEEV